MAKSIHQKLADLMKKRLNAIDSYINQCAQQFNLILLHFYEQQFIWGRPLMSKKTLHEMMHTHYMSLRRFAISSELKKIYKITPWLGTVISKHIFLNNQIVKKQKARWFIPWGVKIVFPSDNKKLIEEGHQRAILYCPDDSELSNEVDWFEKEDAMNSLTHQMFTDIAEQA